MYLRMVFALLLLSPAASAWAGSHSPRPNAPAPTAPATAIGGVQIGSGDISIDAKGNIRVHTVPAEVVISPDSSGVRPQGPTDVYIAPRLVNGPGDPVFGRDLILNPFAPYGAFNRDSELLNRLSLYFSTASGGFGFRIAFDHRLSPVLRVIAGPEFLTYSLARATRILGDAMPAQTTRITLFALPVGLQRQFAAETRVVPHIGFGLGPIVRFDHHSPRPGYYSYGSIDSAIGYGNDGLGFTVPLFAGDYPSMSLTLGGNVNSGINFRLGQAKDIALTIEGRYTFARFTEALGSPGDFSGFSLGIGLGKYF